MSRVKGPFWSIFTLIFCKLVNICILYYNSLYFTIPFRWKTRDSPHFTIVKWGLSLLRRSQWLTKKHPVGHPLAYQPGEALRGVFGQPNAAKTPSGKSTLILQPYDTPRNVSLQVRATLALHLYIFVLHKGTCLQIDILLAD